MLSGMIHIDTFVDAALWPLPTAKTHQPCYSIMGHKD